MNMEAIAPAEVFRICEEAIRTVAETQKADERSALREIIKAVITQEVISMNTFMANPIRLRKNGMLSMLRIVLLDAWLQK